MAGKGKITDSSQQVDSYYPTPTAIPSGTRCLILEIPDSAEWYGLALGALWELMLVQNYEKFGIDVDLTVDRWLEVFRTMEVNCVNVPIGTMAMHGSDTAPDKWLLCDGIEVDRTIYADLFEVIGTIHGIGNGTTTFNLPNMIGRSPMGRDLSLVDVGQAAGALTHALTAAQNGAHTHVIEKSNGIAGGSVSRPGASFSGQLAPNTQTLSSGTGAPHNNLHPVMGLIFIIYAGQ